MNTRESRKSEKLLQELWIDFPQLIVCVWYPIGDQAVYYAEKMIKLLQDLIVQLKEEQMERRELIKKGKNNA